jgi:hypothetical protein
MILCLPGLPLQRTVATQKPNSRFKNPVAPMAYISLMPRLIWPARLAVAPKGRSDFFPNWREPLLG